MRIRLLKFDAPLILNHIFTKESAEALVEEYGKHVFHVHAKLSTSDLEDDFCPRIIGCVSDLCVDDETKTVTGFLNYTNPVYADLLKFLKHDVCLVGEGITGYDPETRQDVVFNYDPLYVLFQLQGEMNESKAAEI